MGSANAGVRSTNPRSRRRRMRIAALCAVAAVLGAGALALSSVAAARSSAPAGSTANWPVYHRTFSGSGIASGTDSYQSAKAVWTSSVLDGQLYGEPLVSGTTVVVATENDTVYALDAATRGSILWSRHLGTPVPAGDLPCGDIRPVVGITSSPVIDAARDEVFAVADEDTDHSISHHLVGLSLATGKVLLDQRVDPPGSDHAALLQRAALTLSAGRVIIGFGGNAGDCSTYHGWVVGAPVTGGALRTFEVDSAAGNDQGAVWMGGAAPAVSGSGDIWVATGNGSNTSGASPDDSDAVIELSSALRPLQFFSPSTWASDNGHDLDLGSSSPALFADGLVFQAGKSRTAYLLNGSHLGGVGHQLATLSSFCGSTVDGGTAIAGQTVYVPCSNGIMSVRVTASPAKMTVLWRSSSDSSGPPIVAGSLVWTISQGGVLYGLDRNTGTPLVQFSIGSVANHFPTPSIGDGLLLAPSADRVHTFG